MNASYIDVSCDNFLFVRLQTIDNLSFYEHLDEKSGWTKLTSMH